MFEFNSVYSSRLERVNWAFLSEQNRCSWHYSHSHSLLNVSCVCVKSKAKIRRQNDKKSFLACTSSSIRVLPSLWVHNREVGVVVVLLLFLCLKLQTFLLNWGTIESVKSVNWYVFNDWSTASNDSCSQSGGSVAKERQTIIFFSSCLFRVSTAIDFFSSERNVDKKVIERPTKIFFAFFTRFLQVVSVLFLDKKKSREQLHASTAVVKKLQNDELKWVSNFNTLLSLQTLDWERNWERDWERQKQDKLSAEKRPLD